ncbi:DnaJ-domain-containing protein [Annulohypoxylon moriforme]|nr:DnaJ-domain-containing protein [Annulohypoxylon moriforme]
MSSVPSVDLYAILEVERTATAAEITASYRRLALVHHPDKNPGNVEAATETFQKLQVAYDVLSDTEKRAHYDARSAANSGSSSAGSQGPFHHSSSHYSYTPSARSGGYYDFLNQLFSEFRDDSWYTASRESARQQHRERMAAMEREIAEHVEEYRTRRNVEEHIKQNREAAKQARLASEKAKRDELQATERSKQELRWEQLGAVTKDERLRACLHSEHCTKMLQRQKFKCDVCQVKRGITAFECPYCSSLLCRQCVVEFSKKRATPEKAPARHYEPTVNLGWASTSEEEEEVEAEASGPNKKQPNTKPQGSRGHPKNPPAPPRCYKCYKLGHLAKFCRSRPERPPGSTLGDKKYWHRTQGKPNGDGGEGSGQAQGQ